MDSQDRSESKAQYVAVCCCPGAGRATFWGILLVLFGALGLLSIVLPSVNLGRYLLPAFLILWGTYLLFGRRLFHEPG